MKEKDNLNTLLNINNSLDNNDNDQIVESVKIHNASKEMEDALSSFIVARFEKLQTDAGFEDLIKMHLRQRIAEATFEQLIQLHHEMSQDSTAAVKDMLQMFKENVSGKIITEHLKDSEVSTTAQRLYDSTDDKKILQAVSYFSQIMSQIGANIPQEQATPNKN